MASFNKVIIAGNLTADPELTYSPKGTAIASLSVAVNRVWTDESGQKKEEVTFVNCQSFGRTAENIGQYMRKGRPLLMEGRLKQETWEDKQTGQKKSRIVVIVETCQFLGGKSDDTEPARERIGSGNPKPQAPTATVAGDEPNTSDDVPF